PSWSLILKGTQSPTTSSHGPGRCWAGTRSPCTMGRFPWRQPFGRANSLVWRAKPGCETSALRHSVQPSGSLCSANLHSPLEACKNVDLAGLPPQAGSVAHPHFGPVPNWQMAGQFRACHRHRLGERTHAVPSWRRRGGDKNLKMPEENFNSSHSTRFLGREAGREAIQIVVSWIIAPVPPPFHNIPGGPDCRCGELVRLGNGKALQ